MDDYNQEKALHTCAELGAIMAGETTHEGGNFVFCTSDRNALKPDLGNRRFFVIAADGAYNSYIGHKDIADFFDGMTYIVELNKIRLAKGDIVDRGRFDALYGGFTFEMDRINDRITHSAWDAFLNNQIRRFPREFSVGQVVAWIIERPGVPPVICHYADVADELSKRPDHVVTPYHSKVKP